MGNSRRQPWPVLALVGPTAAGKSAVALALGQQLPIEIISLDSAQVYQGLDIGTAKPSAAERAALPHHLIDIRAPEQSYSAAEFARDAKQLIAQIQARQRLPLLVGGTMLYLRALEQGLNDLPSADSAVRAQIEAEARQQGWPALHAQLAQHDPKSAARLAPNDAQRIQRALEVWRLTGRSLSSHHQRGLLTADPVLHPLGLISLEPRERAWLHQRIAGRFEAMLALGLVEEVQALRARGTLHAALPSMRCVGYRQTWDWLQARDSGTPQPLAELRERGIFATRQLAKRQLTWLRAMPQRQVFVAEAPDLAQQVLQHVLARVLPSAASA